MKLSSRTACNELTSGFRHHARVGAVAIALLSTLGGCFHHTVMVSGAQPANSVERWQHFLIAGLIPLSEQWDARTDCRNGIAKVESSMRAANVLLTAITVGIYSSVTVKVWCAQGAVSTDAPSSRTYIVVPGPTSLNLLRREYPDLKEMARQEVAREDVKIAKLDRAAGIF